MKDKTSSTTHRSKLKNQATHLVQVQPLHYRELRELAEASAGVQNQSVDFFFPEGKELRRAQPGQTFADTDVLVPAYNRGKFPRNRISLSVTDEIPPFDRRLEGADAVFWSDAAVHKFLIPFAASFGGESAGEWVTDIQEAWNFYPPQEVTVYALVHLTPIQTDEKLDPTRSLLVAFLKNGATELDYLPIPDFIKAFPHMKPDTPPDEPVDYQRGDPTAPPQRPDYAQLRAMAEFAASLRDERKYFVFRSGEQGFDPPTSELPELNPGDIVVPTFSRTVPAGRPVLGGVFFQAQGQTKIDNLANDGDALFWSSGSIEQFVIPYYASRGGLQSLPDLADIATTWENTGPGGGPRTHASPPIPVGGGDAVRVAAVAEVQVYGLIHLPTSQWTEVGAGFNVTGVNPSSQLGMVGPKGDGPTVVYRPRHLTGLR
jgi:hypothetical protein